MIPRLVFLFGLSLLCGTLLACGRARLSPRPGFPSAPEWELYLVRRAGTVGEIALHLYGDSLLAPALGGLNGLTADSVLTRGDRLVVAEDGDHLSELVRGEDSPPAHVHPRLREALLAYDRGTFLAQEGRERESLPYFERALEVAPGMADAHYNLGVSRLACGQLSGAAEALEQAVILRDGRARYRYALAVAYLRGGEEWEARGQFRAALAIDPHYLEARFALARLLEGTGDVRGARREWARYLADDSHSPWAEEARRRLKELGR